MRLLFRADASSRIGSGHLMRCLALAGALTARATDIHFVCRRLPGDLHGLIEARGFRCSLLTAAGHALDQASDARQTAALGDATDWVIVDHYAIDHQWERAMKPTCGRLMVIDDLVDRKHDCDVLLDQTFGRQAGAYDALVPSGCRVLAGTDYALLRPEFAALRPTALSRRQARAGVNHILVSLGGFDPDNRAFDVLETLAGRPYSGRLTVTVVCGAQRADEGAPLRELACHFAQLEIRQRVSDMAELMAASDLAIGAGGTTSWERCCMGLPALVCVMADNQQEVAGSLEAAGAIRTWRSRAELAERLDEFVDNDSIYRSAVAASADICDGRGVERVVAEMLSC